MSRRRRSMMAPAVRTRSPRQLLVPPTRQITRNCRLLAWSLVVAMMGENCLGSACAQLPISLSWQQRADQLGGKTPWYPRKDTLPAIKSTRSHRVRSNAYDVLLYEKLPAISIFHWVKNRRPRKGFCYDRLAQATDDSVPHKKPERYLQ